MIKDHYSSIDHKLERIFMLKEHHGNVEIEKLYLFEI